MGSTAVVTAIFGTIGILAITAGGTLSAFTARRPARLTSWMSAYLVLVAGLIQFGLAVGWQWLDTDPVPLATIAFVVFNLGNAAVIAGRALKSRSARALLLVQAGGALLAVAMALLAWSVRHAEASWTLAWFLALVIVILISMPIGLTLSARRASK